MAFQPRTFDTIVNDAINYIRANSNITDFNVGSVIRTIVEAFSLEDDEQYFQMVQLKDAFSLQTAAGSDLDERVAEYDLVRILPSASAGYVQFNNGAATTTTMLSLSGGGSTLALASSDDFPIPGPTFQVRIGEGTANAETVTVTANNTATDTLTLSPAAVNSHSAGETVTLLVGSDINIASGISVRAPSSGGSPAIDFVTTAAATILDGNLYSETVPAVATSTGTQTNVGPNRITQFSGSPPFAGAEVSNPSSFSSGRDLETDQALRDRARQAIQSLTKGTVLTLSSQVLGVEDTTTNQRVVSARLREDFVNNEVILYIDDGTGNVATSNQVAFADTTLAVALVGGETTVQVSTISEFTPTGHALILDNVAGGETNEVVEYDALLTGPSRLDLVGATTVANAHSNTSMVRQVEVLTLAAEAGQKKFKTQLAPIIRGTLVVYADKNVGEYALQVEGTDYEANIASGEITFLGTGLPAGAKAIAHYAYYTGLIATVQKVVDGDPLDSANFPGLKAAGIKVIVEPPTIKNIPVQITISAASGFKEEDLTTPVIQAIEAYINSRGVGEDIIVAELIQRVQSVQLNGVEAVLDTRVITPASNVVVLEDELPRTDPSIIVVT